MRTIQVDDDVYRALEAKVQEFGDSPNTVLRRILEIRPEEDALSHHRLPKRTNASFSRKRGKAPKTNLRDLIRVGSVSEGQVLYMHDYQGNRLDGIQAQVCGNDLEHEGKCMSMSALTKQIMQREGYQSGSYRGPQFWYTAEGKCVKELWDDYLQTFAE